MIKYLYCTDFNCMYSSFIYDFFSAAVLLILVLQLEGIVVMQLLLSKRMTIFI